MEVGAGKEERSSGSNTLADCIVITKILFKSKYTMTVLR